jgi:choline dehydrogenase
MCNLVKNSILSVKCHFLSPVVGSGAGGAVVASRLSKKYSVLLLEAGKPDNVLEIKIPAAFPKLFHTVHDWDYYTEPQVSVNNRKMYWPRGKVIGGSGSMNAMILARGHKSDYDNFGKENKGWSYDDVLPCNQK